MTHILLFRSELIRPYTRMSRGADNAFSDAMLTLLGGTRRRR